MHTLTCERQADRAKDRSASPARARSDSRDRRRRRSDSRDYDRRRRSDSRDDDRRRSRRDDRDRSRCAGFFSAAYENRGAPASASLAGLFSLPR